MRSAPKDSEISQQVEARLKLYTDNERPQEQNIIQQACPEITPLTEYLLVVRRDVEACDELVAAVSNYAAKDGRILIKELDKL